MTVAAPRIALSVGAAALLLSSCGTTWKALSEPPAPQVGCTEKMHAPFPPPGAHVDQAAIVVTKSAPIYPQIAREAGVDGTVMVSALVCEHGHVVEARVVKSIPMLDAAACEAARKWTFFMSGRES